MNGDDIMDIINLNGVEYIKRDTIKNLEQERDELIKKIEAISDIINPSTKQKEIKTEKKAKHRPYKYGKSDEPYQIPKSAQMLWNIRFMNEFGQFFNKDNRKLKITIKHVLELQKTLSKSTTNGDIKELGKEIGLDYQMIHRLAYNYKEGIFDKFIKDWNKQQSTIITRKNLPVENNPEKRKEAGIYGI